LSADSWQNVNGEGWRTHFNPPLTHWLSTAQELGQHYSEFGSGYVPHHVVIGKDYRVFYTDCYLNEENFRILLDETIAAYQPDNVLPEICGISGTAGHPGGDLQPIIKINDVSFLESVIGFYNVGNGEQQLNFELCGTDRFLYNYTAVIPAQNSETEGTIFFQITDTQGNLTQSDVYSLRWIEGVIPWELQFSFSHPTDPEIGPSVSLGFDGEYFYSTQYGEGMIYKYNHEGEIVSTFSPHGFCETYGLTWDGEYFFGGHFGSTIWQIDPEDFSIVSSISCPGSAVYGIAYDPDTDAFWTTDSAYNIILINRSGNIITTFANPGYTFPAGFAYDNVSEGGPYLWVADRGEGYGFPQYIRQIELGNGTFTGENFDITVAIGNCKAYGLLSTSDYTSGIFTLAGMGRMGTGPGAASTIYGFQYCGYTAIEDHQEVVVPTMNLTCYPNPCRIDTNANTKNESNIRISFTLKKPEKITIEIYNLMGKKVETLLSSVSLEGEQTILWNCRDSQKRILPSGVYFCKVSGTDFSKISKILILK